MDLPLKTEGAHIGRRLAGHVVPAPVYLLTVAQVASAAQLLPDWKGGVFMIR